MQDSHHDPLLPKIAACREKTAEIIASLQGYHKQDDVKEFIQGLRAIENQLDQAYNMKKLLRGYNILDADPLGKIITSSFPSSLTVFIPRENMGALESARRTLRYDVQE